MTRQHLTSPVGEAPPSTSVELRSSCSQLHPAQEPSHSRGVLTPKPHQSPPFPTLFLINELPLSSADPTWHFCGGLIISPTLQSRTLGLKAASHPLKITESPKVWMGQKLPSTYVCMCMCLYNFMSTKEISDALEPLFKVVVGAWKQIWVGLLDLNQ